MHANLFQWWLTRDGGLKSTKSAAVYARRAQAVESAEGCDLDEEWNRDKLARIIEKTETRGDVSPRERSSYRTALRRYADFRDAR